MKLTTLFFSFALLLICISSDCLAQTTGSFSSAPVGVQVHGQIRQTNGKPPAERIVVNLESVNGGNITQTITDSSGKFEFAGLQPTVYIVHVRVAGYREVQRQVDLQTSNSEYVLLQLIPTAPSASVNGTPGVVNANLPEDAQKEFEEGRKALLEEKQTQSGVAHLEKAASLAPNFFDAQFLLGTAYADLRQMEKAESAFRRALEIKPQSAAARFALGEVYRQEKKYKDAEQMLLAGLKIEETSAQGHLSLGRVYWEENDLPQAGRQVGRALQLKPDLAEGHLLAGNILLRARQPENALTEFNEYLRLAPNGEYADQARQIAQKIQNALANKKKSS